MSEEDFECPTDTEVWELRCNHQLLTNLRRKHFIERKNIASVRCTPSQYKIPRFNQQ